MAKYPDFRSAAIPALAAAQRAPRLVLARGDRAGRLRHAPDARLPDRRRVVLRHARDAARSARNASTSARTSPARCAAPTSCSRASRSEVGDDPDFNVRSFECLGACDIAPMASVNDVYVGPIALDDVPTLVEQIRAGDAAAAGQAAVTCARCTDPGGARHEPIDDPLQGHRRARPAHDRRLPPARRLRARCARR